jgi:hypothetical protein
MAKKVAKKVAKKGDPCGPVGLKFIVQYKDKAVAAQIVQEGFKAGDKIFFTPRDLSEHVTGKRLRYCVTDGIKRALADKPVKTAKPAVAKVAVKTTAGPVAKVVAEVTKVTKVAEPPEGDGASDE